jgi:hypothetical protein
MMDSSLPPVTHIRVTLSDFLTHFTLKQHKGWLLRKMPEVRITLDKMLKDWLFIKFMVFNDFLRNLALK